MTTAARPTFEPARGGRGKGEGDLSQLSKQYSSRDLPSHTKIKYRQTTQDAPEEVRNRDFRRELEERERAAAREKNRDRPTREHTTSSSEDEDEDFEEESDDDDTAALLAELEKIKKERAEEQARKMMYMLSIFLALQLTFFMSPDTDMWDDDVVFKNCAKGVDDQKKDKRFVNDTLRSEFHKKFMEKYIK
uniref:Spliceosome-associated protein CWC15 homolog n=1 Tax=Panthera tigris altaica TaxID=74533 RepID=A0A8C9KPW6_PANTA